MDFIKALFLIDDTDGEVFAYFPEEESSCVDPELRACYARIGGHGSCHPDSAAECREATEAEARDLLDELANLYDTPEDDGGDRLIIVPINTWLNEYASEAEARRAIRDFYRELADSGDPWGSAIGFHFKICDVLHLRMGDTSNADEATSIGAALDRWDFRPGAFVVEADDHAADDPSFWDLRRFPTPALIHFGDVLDRYTRSLRRAGMDY